MKLTDAEWAVMEALWSAERMTLSEAVNALRPVKGWNKNTVFTYLTRMEHKGLVALDRTHDRPYAAAVSREVCAREERDDLLSRVYGGATGDLIAAFLKESAISKEEVERLKQMLDEMEV